MFRAHVPLVRRPKLYYTTSGIITPIGGRPVHRLREDTLSCFYMFRALCAHRQEAKIVLYSLWWYHHHTYRFDDTRDCIVQFWPPDDELLCSKHEEAWNKLIIKFSASSWLILRYVYWDARSAKCQKTVDWSCAFLDVCNCRVII